VAREGPSGIYNLAQIASSRWTLSLAGRILLALRQRNNGKDFDCLLLARRVFSTRQALPTRSRDEQSVKVPSVHPYRAIFELRAQEQRTSRSAEGPDKPLVPRAWPRRTIQAASAFDTPWFCFDLAESQLYQAREVFLIAAMQGFSQTGQHWQWRKPRRNLARCCCQLRTRFAVTEEGIAELSKLLPDG